MKISGNPHLGSSFDDYLAEEGLLEECEAAALKEIMTMMQQDPPKEDAQAKTTPH